MDEIIALLKSGMPWYVTALMVVGGIYVGRWMDVWIKLRMQRMEERKYEDGLTKEERDALVEQLRQQLKDMKADLTSVIAELKEVRAAHSKCEIQHAELKGKMEVMEVKMARLEAHDKANKDQLEVLKEDLGKV